MARQRGWKIILRIEDLDGPRIKSGADQLAIEDLRWLGIDWDDGPLYQTARLDHYRAPLAQLLAANRAYPCICTRKEVDAALSAPHAEDGASIYPGTCRDRFASLDDARAHSRGREPALRLDTRGAAIDFTDEFSGPHHFNVATQLGDFVIARGDGIPAYQLAVVIDDVDMGVTDIVRGDDLLDSAARQILLYRDLHLGPPPRYWHLPLVIGADGRRLAKRHGDTRVASYREAGAAPGRVLALLASWCGIAGVNDSSISSAADLLERFDIAFVPRQPIVFDPRTFSI
jgi:glutamyl-tRNA synthetase